MKFQLLLASCLLVAVNSQSMSTTPPTWFLSNVAGMVTQITFPSLSLSQIFVDTTMNCNSLFGTLASVTTINPFYNTLIPFYQDGKQNYTYIYNQLQSSVNEAVNGIINNITAWETDVLIVLKELDNVARIAIDVINGRKECGSSDVSNFVMTITNPFTSFGTQLNQVFQTFTSTINDIGYQLTPQLEWIINYSLQDAADPLAALEDCEICYLNPTLAFIKREYWNTLFVMDYIINANYHLQLTLLRSAIANILALAFNYQCTLPNITPCCGAQY